MSLQPPDLRVSVLLIAYNHAPYIRQALESVLTQVVSFPYEVIVADDASTDGTPVICAEIARDHPGRVHILPRVRNLGVGESLRDGLRHCAGEFVALLEGDDHWISPQKLQRQVTLFDAHPEWSGSFHAVRVQHESDARPSEVRSASRFIRHGVLPVDEILRANRVMTCSVMYRRAHLNSLPHWLFDRWMIDWPLSALVAANGAIGYFDEPLAVYRVHAGGLWSGGSADGRLGQVVSMYQHLLPIFGEHFKAQIVEGMARQIRMWTTSRDSSWTALMCAERFRKQFVAMLGPDSRVEDYQLCLSILKSLVGAGNLPLAALYAPLMAWRHPGITVRTARRATAQWLRR